MLPAFGRFNERGGGGGGVLSIFGRFNKWGGVACVQKKKSQYRLTVAVSGKIKCSIEDKRVVAHN